MEKMCWRIACEDILGLGNNIYKDSVSFLFFPQPCPHPIHLPEILDSHSS